jgi:type I restriction enzyme S subunit
MGKLEKYTSYKDSGVEWLGEIPEHWEVEKLFGLCNFIRGNSSFSKDELLNNGKYVALQYGKTYKVDKVDEKYEFYVNDEFYKSSQIVNFGDTIFISTSESIEDLGHSAYYKRIDLGLLGGEQILLNSKIEIIDSKYLYFSSKVFSKELQRFATGIKVFRFNINDLKTIYIPLPPKEEQTKIASFLDEKTSQIDKAISQKEKLIELLKERRQITINEAVTKGLDKDVEFKDSGVEWIGKIPKHWEVFPGLRVFSENKRKNAGMIDDRVLSLSYGRIIRKPKEKLVGLVPESFETYQIVKAGDIIIRCTDLQNDKVSLRTALAKDDGIITSAYLNLNVKNGSSEYWHYLLHVLDITKAIYKLGSGLRQNLSFNDFKRLDIVLPPKEEQIQIVEYIETQTAKIDKAIELQQNHIAKLKEYKASLIDSVVTGKVRVA